MRLGQDVGRGVPAAMAAGALALGVVSCGSSPQATSATAGASGAAALRLTQAPTPRFRVPKYETKGTYARVRGASDLERVNAALRRIVTSDQRAYAKPARRAARGAGSRARGLYETTVDARLTSASTVVVSVLLPAIKLFPNGNEGQTFVAGTVMVPSGRRVALRQLFADPRRALPVLAREWKRAFRRAHPRAYVCVCDLLPLFRPTARNYQLFALLPAGLAVGFPGGHCARLEATVPYARLRPYFSHLGRALIHGVRRPGAAP